MYEIKIFANKIYIYLTFLIIIFLIALGAVWMVILIKEVWSCCVYFILVSDAQLIALWVNINQKFKIIL